MLTNSETGAQALQKSRQAGRALSSGEGARFDFELLVGKHFRWDELLYPVPAAVKTLGLVTLLAAQLPNDVDLSNTAPQNGFKYVRHPKSFRATTIQLGNDAWSALNVAQKNMHFIYLECSQIENHVKNTVLALLKRDVNIINEIVPQALSKIKDITLECVKKASETEKDFQKVMNLTAEVSESCASKQGQINEDLKKNEAEARYTKNKLEEEEKEAKRFAEEENEMKKSTEEAEKKFQAVMNESPSAGHLFGLALGDALIEVVKFVPNMFKSYDETKQLSGFTQSKNKGRKKKEISRRFKSSLANTILKAQTMLNQFDEVCSKKTDNSLKNDEIQNNYRDCMAFFADQLKTNSKDNDDEINDLFKEGHNIAEKILNQFNQVESNKENEMAKLKKRLQEFQSSVFTVTSKYKSIEEQLSDVGETPSQAMQNDAKLTGNSSVMNAYVETHRMKMMLMEQVLKNNKEEYKVKVKEATEARRRMNETIRELEKINLNHLSLTEIQDVLFKAMGLIGELREHWSKLVLWFEGMATLMQVVLTDHVDEFTKRAASGKKFLNDDMNDSFNNIIDIIFNTTKSCLFTAHCVQSLASTYYTISDKYVIHSIAGFSQIMALDPQKDIHKIDVVREKLFSDCDNAEKKINDEIEQHTNKMMEQAQKRREQIQDTMRKTLPPISPQEEVRLSAIVTKSTENLEDFV